MLKSKQSQSTNNSKLDPSVSSSSPCLNSNGRTTSSKNTTHTTIQRNQNASIKKTASMNCMNHSESDVHDYQHGQKNNMTTSKKPPPVPNKNTNGHRPTSAIKVQPKNKLQSPSMNTNTNTINDTNGVTSATLATTTTISPPNLTSDRFFFSLLTSKNTDSAITRKNLNHDVDDQKDVSVESLHKLNFEQQLQTGIQLIQNAFQSKMDLLINEVEHWKQLATLQKQQLQELESNLINMNQENLNLNQHISDLNQENQDLRNSNHQLNEKYIQLKKNAVQLENFRKSIASMVSLNPLEVNIDNQESKPALVKRTNTTDGPNRNNTNQQDIHLKVHEEQVAAFAREEEEGIEEIQSIIDLPIPNSNVPIPYAQEVDVPDEDRQEREMVHKSADNHTSPSSKDQYQELSVELSQGLISFMDHQPHSFKSKVTSPPKRISSRPPLQNDSPSPSSYPLSFKNTSPSSLLIESHSSALNHGKNKHDHEMNINDFENQEKLATENTSLLQQHPQRQQQKMVMDVPTVYRQIKDLLSTKEFDAFAAIITAFNRSLISPEETIERVNSIVKDEALCIQMEVLIKTVVQQPLHQF